MNATKVLIDKEIRHWRQFQGLVWCIIIPLYRNESIQGMHIPQFLLISFVAGILSPVILHPLSSLARPGK